MKTIIAAGPVIVDKKKVLLVKHGDDNFWKFPGGKIDANLGLVENTKQNVKNELGIDIEIADKEPFVMHLVREEKIDAILVHYLAKVVGEIKPGEDIREWKWISLDKLDTEDLGPNIEPALVNFWFLDK